jgi:hypothetical protein
MKKFFIALVLSLLPLAASAVVVPNVSQQIAAPYFGVVMATSTNGKLFASSSPTILYLTATSTTATSTFGYGINISGGCFAVRSVCLGAGGSGTVTSVDVSGGTTGLTFTGGAITTSGTITAGGTLNVANGGTGLGSFTANRILYSNAAGTGLAFAATSSLGIVFSDTTGTVGVTRGGTGLTSYNSGDILFASAANTLTALASSTGGTVLMTAFANGRPSWVGTSTLGLMSTSTTNLFIDASSTIPKTYSTNTFTGANTFSAALIGALSVTGGTITAGNGFSNSNPVYSFVGDTNTGLNDLTDTLTFITNANEQGRVGSTGKWSLGTSTLNTAELTVQGTMLVQGTSATNGDINVKSFDYNSDFSMQAVQGASTKFQIHDNKNNRNPFVMSGANDGTFTLSGNGEVGINSASPASGLYIKNAFGAAFPAFSDPVSNLVSRSAYNLTINNENAITGSSTGMCFMVSSNSDNCGNSIIFVATGANNQGELRIYTKASAVSGTASLQAAVFSNAQNLGLGTSTPSQRLSIQGSILASSTGATSTFMGTGINLVPSAGVTPCYAVSGNCISLSNIGGSLPVGAQTSRLRFKVSTSTLPWTGTSTPLAIESAYGEVWNTVQCFTDAGTLNVDFYHGSSHLDNFNASSTNGIITFTTNNTMTANDKVYVTFGTPASSPTVINCTVKYTE